MFTYKSDNSIYSFEYHEKGEFRMGVEGYSLVIWKQGSPHITYFEDMWAYVGPLSEDRSPVKESDDGKYAVINNNHGNIFVVDLEEELISLYRTDVRYDKYISSENAVTGNETRHIRGEGFFYYLQFPFLNQQAFEKKYNEYHALRSNQLMSLVNK